MAAAWTGRSFLSMGQTLPLTINDDPIGLFSLTRWMNIARQAANKALEHGVFGLKVKNNVRLILMNQHSYLSILLLLCLSHPLTDCL